jgi:hypothetical protein
LPVLETVKAEEPELTCKREVGEENPIPTLPPSVNLTVSDAAGSKAISSTPAVAVVLIFRVGLEALLLIIR